MRFRILSQLISVLLFVVPAFSQGLNEELKRGPIEVAYKLNMSHADFTKEIEMNPKDLNAYVERGYLMYLDNNLRAAISDYNRALELKPDFVDAIYRRAIAKHALQDYRGAILDYSKIIDISREDSMKGIEYQKKETKKKKPIWFYWHKETLLALNGRGNARCQLGKYSEAILDFKEVIKRDPKNGYAFYFRGIARIYLDEKEEGCLDLSKSGELGDPYAYKAIKNLCQ